MENELRQQLEKRTIKLLEMTKNEKHKYEVQRKTLYGFYEKGINEEEWSKYIEQFEKELKMNSK